LSYKYKLAKKYTFFKESLINIKSVFSQSENSIHKARNELKIITIENQEYIVKSFKIPNILNQIVYSFFRDSKAKKSFNYSIKLKEFTPEPVAYIEFKSYMLLKNSYFISQYFKYDFTIREPLLDQNFPKRELIFQAFAQFTLELHNNNIYHNDYSPGNILIKKEEDGNFTFKIVDINRMDFFELKEEDRAKNFSKLWASEEELTIMAREYAKNYSCSNDFIKKVIDYSNKNKKIKNFKKKLKGKAVND
jgi:serine/threonine protein kinase